MSARTGATIHEVREFAGHADIRTTELDFVRREDDAEVAGGLIPHTPDFRCETTGPYTEGERGVIQQA